jgi:hypothetical protein
MTYAVCIVPVAPLRKFADHTAEMVSQLLFGEYCRVTETTKDGFAKIVVAYDGYEGWCQLQQLAGQEAAVSTNAVASLAADWASLLHCNDAAMYVPFGSTLSINKEEKIVVGADIYSAACNTFTILSAESKSIQQIAFTFLNTPYLWGGRSVFGIDCSGFTQMVYKFFGIALLRDASMQATQGVTVDFLQQAQYGDLAFFDNDAGKIIHVGILLNSNEIIHASGKVQVDDIDNGGIINRITGQRTQKLRIIKRLF